MKLSQMTTVQQLAIPRIMEGKDVLVKSQTGAGKTLCYAVPIIQDLQGRNPRVQRNDGVHAIIIVPSREPFQWIVPCYLIGGEKTKAQKARLRKGMNILVATPGRLMDHIEHTASLSLANVQWLVLDEADRMLDMGYEKEVAKILTKLNNAKTSGSIQTILVSATLTEGVERLAGISLTDPVIVDAVTNRHACTESIKLAEGINTENLKNFVLPEKLKQHFVITPCKLRLVTLAAFVLGKCKFSSHPGKMIVFLSTQVAVDFHYQIFSHFFGGGSQGLLEEEGGDDDD
ncbi:hypothetical protein FSP39_012561 [Pinctada imbricata]|uniref:ATP-dependent RNA helicase n=1 Tax=Pinctada imbricata TaxID=66713 RepID=A0AA89BUK2_PINIB|nr:hypothetical protein FSP39_012561 [Pinctada imbricata]